MANMLCMVEFARRDNAFPCGRYGVVRVVFVSEYLFQLVEYLILEFGPLF